MKPILTVGMTVHDDYDGVYFTVQSIRMHSGLAREALEFIIVDQNPGSAYGKLTREFAARVGAKYFPQSDKVGPPHGRNLYFEKASADIVLSVDCHVLFDTGAVKSVIDHLSKEENARDLVHGPLIYDDWGVSTHWKPEWKPGDQSFGSWDTDPRGLDPEAPAFEIPMSGVGVMACRKAAWPVYTAPFMGFGAEEWYIHRKHRMLGGRVVCLPKLRWMHRFGRMPHANYPIFLWQKMYNHLVGSIELGDVEDVITQMKHWHTIEPACLNQALENLHKRKLIKLEDATNADRSIVAVGG